MTMISAVVALGIQALCIIVGLAFIIKCIVDYIFYRIEQTYDLDRFRKDE